MRVRVELRIDARTVATGTAFESELDEPDGFSLILDPTLDALKSGVFTQSTRIELALQTEGFKFWIGEDE